MNIAEAIDWALSIELMSIVKVVGGYFAASIVYVVVKGW